MLCGGVAPGLQQPTPEVQAILDAHRGEIEAQLNGGAAFGQWQLLGYSTQVVAGTNYWLKVQVADGQVIHAKIYQTLPHAGETTELLEAQAGKAVGDAFV